MIGISVSAGEDSNGYGVFSSEVPPVITSQLRGWPAGSGSRERSSGEASRVSASVHRYDDRARCRPARQAKARCYAIPGRPLQPKTPDLAVLCIAPDNFLGRRLTEQCEFLLVYVTNIVNTSYGRCHVCSAGAVSLPDVSFLNDKPTRYRRPVSALRGKSRLDPGSVGRRRSAYRAAQSRSGRPAAPVSHQNLTRVAGALGVGVEHLMMA